MVRAETKGATTADKESWQVKRIAEERTNAGSKTSLFLEYNVQSHVTDQGVKVN